MMIRDRIALGLIDLISDNYPSVIGDYTDTDPPTPLPQSHSLSLSPVRSRDGHAGGGGGRGDGQEQAVSGPGSRGIRGRQVGLTRAQTDI